VRCDFFHQDFDNMYLAVADCIGHGVPRVLLSMLGIAFLKGIISKKLHANSVLISNEMRSMLKSLMQQRDKTNTLQDGMDILFCSIYVTTLEMSFTGSHQHIRIWRTNNEMESDNECTKIKVDGMLLGGATKHRFMNTKFSYNQTSICIFFQMVLLHSSTTTILKNFEHNDSMLYQMIYAAMKLIINVTPLMNLCRFGKKKPNK